MTLDLNKIANEWSYRVGVIDIKNKKHIYHLNNILNEQKVPYDVIDEVINSLTEVKLTKKALQQRIADMSSDLSAPSNTGRIANDGDLSDEAFINLLKKEFGIEKVEVLKPLTGQNKSSKFNMFLFDYDENSYEITLAGKISGRGTAQTKDQELAFLLALSAIHAGANTNNKEEFLSMMLDPSVYKEVYDGTSISEKQALGLVSFLENNEDWYTSTIAQTSKLSTIVGNSPKRYVKDDSKLDINKLAKDLYKKDYNSNLDLDKWNPADVWLYYDNSAPKSDSLAELNNYLLDSLKKGNGIIGVSLKKRKG